MHFMKIFLYSLIIIILGFIALQFIIHPNKKNFDEDPVGHHRYVISQAHKLIGFDLLDPEQAPQYDHEAVMQGYRIIMNTPFYAPNYARDQLSCTNCHFMGGDTLGGKDNGISLVGVTTQYPRFSERDGREIDLAERINMCFTRSMSGNPLPVESDQMKAIIAYLNWISKEVMQIKNIPWLGLPKLKSEHVPNVAVGEKLYVKYCAQCHREDGQGGGILIGSMGKQIPPLWGPNSFNDAAGMSEIGKLAPFIYLNMPLGNAVLSEDQALDVAEFVLKQPRLIIH